MCIPVQADSIGAVLGTYVPQDRLANLVGAASVGAPAAIADAAAAGVAGFGVVGVKRSAACL